MRTLVLISTIAMETLRRARRKRHLPVLFVASMGMAGLISYLTFFGTGQYQQFFCHMMMFVLPMMSVLVAVLSSCSVLPQQMADRTVHLMLARPVRRWHVVAGTYMGTCATSLAVYVVFAAMFLLALTWRGIAFPPALFHALFLLAIQVSFFCAFAILLSLLTTPAMAATVCIFYYFVGQGVQPTLARQLAGESAVQRASSWTLYVILPHLNYFDLTTPVVNPQWGVVPWMDLMPVTVYGVGWTLLLLLFATMRFNRIDL